MFKLIVGLLLTSSIGYADWHKDNKDHIFGDIDECTRASKNRKQTTKHASHCFALAEHSSSVNQKHMSQNNKFLVVGYLNTIYTRELNKNNKLVKRIIAGPKSMLTEIIALTISSNNDEIAVLNKVENDYQILVFESRLHGPVVPSRVLQNDNFRGTTDISMHPNDKSYVLTVPEENKILTVNKNAESRTQRPKDKLIVKDLLPKEIIVNRPNVVITENNNLVFYSSIDQKLYNYNLKSKELTSTQSNSIAEIISDYGSLKKRTIAEDKN